MGPEDFCRTLHAAGANRRLATEGWVCNQYCWVVWKLAAYEATYPKQLQGKLLTSEVILDQLKFRCDHLPCFPFLSLAKAVMTMTADSRSVLHVRTLLWPYRQAAIGLLKHEQQLSPAYAIINERLFSHTLHVS